MMIIEVIEIIFKSKNSASGNTLNLEKFYFISTGVAQPGRATDL